MDESCLLSPPSSVTICLTTDRCAKNFGGLQQFTIVRLLREIRNTPLTKLLIRRFNHAAGERFEIEPKDKKFCEISSHPL